MDYYKQLNSELITQVQELRQSVAFYQQEVTRITEMLFDEHRHRIEQEQKVLTLLTYHFRETVKHLKPDADLIKLLDLPADGTDETKDKNQLSNRRSSTILLDFRRSLHHRRRSSLEIASPLRQNAISNEQIDDEQDILTSKRQSLPEEDIVPRDMEISTAPTENSLQTSPSNENEGETENEPPNDCMGLSVLLESLNECTEESTFRGETAVTESSTLASFEMESTLQKTNDENDETSAILRESRKMCVEESVIPSPRLQFVEMRRGKYRQEHKAINREPNWWDVKKLTPRKSVSRQETADESVNTMRPCLEDLSNLNISELAMRDQIQNAPSSTPNQTLLREYGSISSFRKSTRLSFAGGTDETITISPTTTELTFKSEKSEPNLSNSTSLRPSRRCKPSSLVEPNLRKKLRNCQTKRK